MRGTVVVTGLVLAAAALAGCQVGGGAASGGNTPGGAGGGVAVGGGTPSPSTAPAPTAPPSTGPSPGAPVGAGTVARCRPGALRLAQLPGSDGAAGTIGIRIQVTNASVRACTVRGYPEFRLTAGMALMVVPEHGRLAGPFASPVSTVTLAPGGHAGFFLAYQNRGLTGSGNCPTATQLHLTLPGQAQAVAGPVDIPVCTGTVDVSAFVPGAQLTF